MTVFKYSVEIFIIKIISALEMATKRKNAGSLFQIPNKNKAFYGRVG